jgi:hypothetical protein
LFEFVHATYGTTTGMQYQIEGLGGFLSLVFRDKALTASAIMFPL